MQQFIFDLIHELEIRKPVDIKLSTRRSKISGLYDPIYSDSGRLKSHKITIWLDKDNRPLKTLIAHELIHAWQEENKKQDIHGESFRDLAQYLESKYNMRDIFDPELDD